MGIPPLKHVYDIANNGGNFSTVQNIQFAVGTVNPNSYVTPQQVRNGSKIKKITLEIEYVYVATGSNVELFDFYVWFNIGGAQARPVPGSVNNSVTKNQIFWQDQAIACNMQITAVGAYVPHIYKWRKEINVPASFQQMNENDTMEFVYQGTNNVAASTLKVKIIYKEIFP